MSTPPERPGAVTFRQALAQIVAALDLPFGYTLTTWAAAALAAHFLGTPRPVEIFAFLGGAVGAYLGIARATARLLAPVTPVRVRKATLANLAPPVAGAAAGLVAWLARPLGPPALGFLAAGCTGTLVYALALAALLRLGAGGRGDDT